MFAGETDKAWRMAAIRGGCVLDTPPVRDVKNTVQVWPGKVKDNCNKKLKQLL